MSDVGFFAGDAAQHLAELLPRAMHMAHRRALCKAGNRRDLAIRMPAHRAKQQTLPRVFFQLRQSPHDPVRHHRSTHSCLQFLQRFGPRRRPVQPLTPLPAAGGVPREIAGDLTHPVLETRSRLKLIELSEAHDRGFLHNVIRLRAIRRDRRRDQPQLRLDPREQPLKLRAACTIRSPHRRDRSQLRLGDILVHRPPARAFSTGRRSRRLERYRFNQRAAGETMERVWVAGKSLHRRITTNLFRPRWGVELRPTPPSPSGRGPHNSHFDRRPTVHERGSLAVGAFPSCQDVRPGPVPCTYAAKTRRNPGFCSRITIARRSRGRHFWDFHERREPVLSLIHQKDQRSPRVRESGKQFSIYPPRPSRRSTFNPPRLQAFKESPSCPRP